METKRLVLAVALSAVVLIVWTRLFPPPERPPVPVAPMTESERLPAREREPETETRSPSLNAPDETPTDANAAASEERITVETDLFEVELTNLGAAALSWKLRGYGRKTRESLEVFPTFEEAAPLPLGGKIGFRGSRFHWTGLFNGSYSRECESRDATTCFLDRKIP